MRSGKSMILASIAGSHHDGCNYDVYDAHRDNYARKEGNYQLALGHVRSALTLIERNLRRRRIWKRIARTFHFSFARESRRNSRGNAKLLSELSRLLPLVLAIASLNLYSKVSS